MTDRTAASCTSTSTSTARVATPPPGGSSRTRSAFSTSTTSRRSDGSRSAACSTRSSSPTASTTALPHVSRPWQSLDPFIPLTAVARVTEHVGLVATASSSFQHPYNIARVSASLDLVSGGRAAWNVVATRAPAAARLFGLRRAARPRRPLRAGRGGRAGRTRPLGVVGTRARSSPTRAPGSSPTPTASTRSTSTGDATSASTARSACPARRRADRCCSRRADRRRARRSPSTYADAVFSVQPHAGRRPGVLPATVKDQAETHGRTPTRSSSSRGCSRCWAAPRPRRTSARRGSTRWPASSEELADPEQHAGPRGRVTSTSTSSCPGTCIEKTRVA